ncbi:MAG: M23 family metallopeptidase, partial [Lactobacillus delbrueckii]
LQLQEDVKEYNAKAASYNEKLAAKKKKLKVEESKHPYHYLKSFIK